MKSLRPILTNSPRIVPMYTYYGNTVMIIDIKNSDTRIRLDDNRLYEIVWEFSDEHGRTIPRIEETGYMKNETAPRVLEKLA